MGDGWTPDAEVIWNWWFKADRKEVPPVLLAATSPLPVSPWDLLAPLAAVAALLLLSLVGRRAPVWVRRTQRRDRR